MAVSEIHHMASFFLSRTKSDGIVVITSNPAELAGQYEKDIPLYIVPTTAQLRRKSQHFNQLLPQAKFIGPKFLSRPFLNNKILICCDYLTPKLLPLNTLTKRRIRQANPLASITITVTSKEDGGNLQTIKNWLKPSRTALFGLARKSVASAHKDQLVVIDGSLIDINRQSFADVSVLAVVPVFNENDIIAATIDHLLSQGVDVHVIDNWSTDGSFETVVSIADKNPQRVSFERFPNTPTNKYEWTNILKRVTTVTADKKQYDWVMLNDADELRWSPWHGVTLKQALSFLDSLHYNAVDYTVFNLVPTVDDFSQEDDPQSFFDYGEFGTIEGYFTQVKTWRNHPQADLASSGGHHVAFPNQRVFPFKFFLAHYPIRSSQQAHNKIFKYRKPRFTAAERKKGWNTHYDNISESDKFIRKNDELVQYNQKHFGEVYLLERISGVGIKHQD